MVAEVTQALLRNEPVLNGVTPLEWVCDAIQCMDAPVCDIILLHIRVYSPQLAA